MILNIKIIFKKEPEGYFSVEVPGLEGCFTDGDTLEDAVKNAQEIICLYLETLEKEGIPIPENEHVRVMSDKEEESLRKGSPASAKKKKGQIDFDITNPNLLETDANVLHPSYA